MKKITINYQLRTAKFEYVKATLEMFVTNEQFEDYVLEMRDECFYTNPICNIGKVVKETLQGIARIVHKNLHTFTVVEVEQEVKRLQKEAEAKPKKFSITPCDMRLACIKGDFFTSGDNGEYGILFDMCKDSANIDELVEYIKDHSRDKTSEEIYSTVSQYGYFVSEVNCQ